MRPPDLNENTLRLLYETGVENLPEQHEWLDCDADEIHDRYVMIGEEVCDEHVTRGFGGCWKTISDALESYDWNAGAPVFIVDLFSPPRSALYTLGLTAHVREAELTLADEHGDPVIP